MALGKRQAISEDDMKYCSYQWCHAESDNIKKDDWEIYTGHSKTLYLCPHHAKLFKIKDKYSMKESKEITYSRICDVSDVIFMSY